MSTRGTLGFILDGKWYAMYNHMDSYPKGLGAEVVKFCKYTTENHGWDKLKKKVAKLKLVTNEKRPTKTQIAKYAPYCNLGVSDGTPKDWYCLLRELQNGIILWHISSGEVKHMLDSHGDISQDYAYIINFDTEMLDFYHFGELRANISLYKTPGNWLK